MHQNTIHIPIRDSYYETFLIIFVCTGALVNTWLLHIALLEKLIIMTTITGYAVYWWRQTVAKINSYSITNITCQHHKQIKVQYYNGGTVVTRLTSFCCITPHFLLLRLESNDIEFAKNHRFQPLKWPVIQRCQQHYWSVINLFCRRSHTLQIKKQFKIPDTQAVNLNLILFPDSAQTHELRALRRWLHTY